MFFHKIAKLIKALMINFPEFSKQYFIDYLMKPKTNNVDSNTRDIELLKLKINEVNSLLLANNKSDLKMKNNNSNTNNIIKRTIRAIPTNTLSSKNTTNDLNSINYINNDVNCSDFLSNIKNELDGIINIPKRNNKSKKELNNKIYKAKTNKIKSNNTILTRNNFTIFDNINNANDSYMKSNYENKKNKQQIICKTISLINPNKKSLTRNNSNRFIFHNNSNNRDKIMEKKINNIIKLDKKSIHRNKENDLNLLNRNLTTTYNGEDNNFIYYNRVKKINLKNQDLTRTNSNNNFKLIKDNNRIYSPYYTNNNTIEKRAYHQINKNTYNAKQPTRVLTTIQKLISKKINANTPNTNSVFQLNKNESSNSFKMLQNNRYGIELSNNIKKSIKQKKINCKTNNNSQNKISDYITPLKKKYFYYYH